MRTPSVEKVLKKSRRMMIDFVEIIDKGRREDYDYSDANRKHMIEILSTPGNYPEEDKINTLLSFHKDTCANVLLQLYPSCGDDVLPDPFADLKILKDFVTLLSALEIENKQMCLIAIYKHLRVKLRLLKMKAAMSESPQAKLLSDSDDLKQKLESDDDYGAEVYDNDHERLQGVEREQLNILADLQRLGVDKSKYQDSDGDEDEVPQFVSDEPIPQATIERYMVLEEEVTRRSDEMVKVLEDINPITGYISDLKRHTEIMERCLNAREAYKQLVKMIQGNLMDFTFGEFTSWLGSLDDGSRNPQEIMNALIEALFGGVHKEFSKEVTNKKKYLAAATYDDEGSQILLLRAIDSFCQKSGPEVVKDIALVLRTLYDEGVLEEEYILRWYNKGVAASGSKNSQIRKNAKPMIEWLQRAKSESECVEN